MSRYGADVKAVDKVVASHTRKKDDVTYGFKEKLTISKARGEENL